MASVPVSVALTHPSAFCTLATAPCADELVGMLYSLSLHHPGARVYVETDRPTQQLVMGLPLPPRLDLRWRVTLDSYTHRRRADMVRDGSWSRFQMTKADVLEAALGEEEDALFLDSDTLITSELQVPEARSKILGVSPAFLPAKIEARFGRFNGGMLWVRRVPGIDIPALWRKYTKTSRFYDQASIEDLAKHVGPAALHTFGPEYNLQGWRWTHAGFGSIAAKLSHDPNSKALRYEGKTLRFVHTHFGAQEFASSNALLVQHMENAGMTAHLLIIERIIRGCWLVILPAQPYTTPLFRHTDDSFRELARMWAGRFPGEVAVRTTKDTPHCWLGGRRTVLLYDRPAVNWVDHESRSKPLRSLIANGGIAGLPNPRPWIFWPRRPSEVENFLASRTETEIRAPRPVGTVLIARIENAKQGAQRSAMFGDAAWRKAIDDMDVGSLGTPAVSQREYLMRLARARFGLCVRGYGPKCHREVELMALGTVPVVLPGVDILGYAEPPVEGVHFLRATSPRELIDIVDGTKYESWLEMSLACRGWYARNVSAEGSLRRTLEVAIYGTPKPDDLVAMQQLLSAGPAVNSTSITTLREQAARLEARAGKRLQHLSPAVVALIGDVNTAALASEPPPTLTKPAVVLGNKTKKKQELNRRRTSVQQEPPRHTTRVLHRPLPTPPSSRSVQPRIVTIGMLRSRGAARQQRPLPTPETLRAILVQHAKLTKRPSRFMGGR
jgi:hypothetical protein